MRADHGELGWWPGRTRLEVIVGAILTQNTTWRNVERAIRALRSARLLSLDALRAADPARLADVIRPSGYFRQKARKLKAFVAYLDAHHAGSLARMARADTDRLRADLLAVWGIGPETADSILLYALDRPVLVVDTYTHRLLRRHRLYPGGGYEEVRTYLEDRLPRRVDLYNDLHAQVVWVGKRFCGTRPRCEACPLRSLLPGGRPAPDVSGRTRLKRARAGR